MSLRTLHKHTSETSCTRLERTLVDNGSKTHQRAVSAFNRASRRSERGIIALGLIDLEDEGQDSIIEGDFSWWGETVPMDFDPDTDRTPSEWDTILVERRNRTVHCGVA